MASTSNREKLLRAGLRVVSRRGFGGTSVRDVVQAAGVPQGSFTNHFTSKEAFGIEVLERHFAKTKTLLASTLENQALPPLARIRNYVGANVKFVHAEGKQSGCLYGNTSAHSGEGSAELRRRNAEILDELERLVAAALADAVKRGDLGRRTDVPSLASFVMASLQGAILLSKAKGDPSPMLDLDRVLFTKVLVP